MSKKKTVTQAPTVTPVISTEPEAQNAQLDTVVTPEVIVEPAVTPVVVETVVESAETVSGTIAPDTTSVVGEVVPEPVKEEVKEDVEEVKANAFSARTNELIAKVKATNNRAANMAINGILDYITNMAPGVTMPAETGARNQAALYRAIKAVIEFSGEAFQVTFTTLLRLINEEKDGVFNERYVFRFIENLTLSPNDQQAFRRIINLLKIASPVEGRADALKQVDFTKSLQFGFSDEGKQRVLTYFNK